MKERNTVNNIELHFLPIPPPTKLLFILGCNPMDTIYHELFSVGGNITYWFRGSSKTSYEEYTKFTAIPTENVAPCYRSYNSIK